MIPGLDCRRLRPGESGLYRAIRLDGLRLCPENFGATYDEERQAPELAFEPAIREGRGDRFVVGAFAGKRPVGIAAFARREGTKRRHRGEISQVYVEPAERGRAIGTALLRALLAEAFALADIDQVELSVVASNTAALHLYWKLGFETYGLHQNYLREGDRRWSECHMLLTRERHAARRGVPLPCAAFSPRCSLAAEPAAKETPCSS